MNIMSTTTNSPFTRPTSVMSLLAEQMQSSCINELKHADNCMSQPIDCKSVDKGHSNISSSAPTHSFIAVSDLPLSYFGIQSDSTAEHNCTVSNDIDLSSPQLPSKRLCHSSTNDGIARPIPIKSHFSNDQESSSCTIELHNRMSCSKTNMTIKTPQRNPSNFSIRQIISPHYKKSAFTPIRSLTSPQTTSSDYSMSPDIESPIHRPASVTSSGFHDCSQQSLLIDPNYSPDSNQTSTCATIINTKAPDSISCVFPRCHSQPCDETVSRNSGNRSVIIGSDNVCTCYKPSSKYPAQVHTPMKRRYPSLRHTRSTSQSDSTYVPNPDSPIHCYCKKPIPNSADTSPKACGSIFAMPKRDSYFFGNGRSYLISLPRIASSPPPVTLQVDPQNVAQGHRQRIGSNSSSLSTSTTTDANTPTVIFNGAMQSKPISNKDSVEDIDMDESLHDNRSTCTIDCQNYENFDITADNKNLCQNNGSGQPARTSRTSSCSASGQSDMTTESYSTTTSADGVSNCTSNISQSINSESSRSEFRDPDDPPEIGFCFSQLNNGTNPADTVSYDEHSSFQELDLDQIELD